MAPLANINGETGSIESKLKGVQNPTIKGRNKEHDITLDIVKQVQNKINDSERALIMTEINNEEIKIITNSGCFKAISEEVVKIKVGDEIKSEVAIARVTDQHYQNDKNGTTFMVKTEFRVTDVATHFQQKSVLHTYLTKTFFMIQGKGKMHDNTFCKDYFHENVMKPFIKKIMDTKGQEIMYMNKMLQDIKKDNQKRKLPEKKEKCDICGRMFINSTGINIHKKRMHVLETKKVVQVPALTRSNSLVSIRSEQSVRSPPPKKSQHEVKTPEVKPEEVTEVKPEEVTELKPEETPLPLEAESIEVDNDNKEDDQPKETEPVKKNYVSDLNLNNEKKESVPNAANK